MTMIQLIACIGMIAGLFVYRKPLARRVVQEKSSDDHVKIKTPFVV